MVKKKLTQVASWGLEPKKKKVDNSILKKYCPFFKEKCKGLNCAFGDTKNEYSFMSQEGATLYCKLFEGLTGRLKFEIETNIKQEN